MLIFLLPRKRKDKLKGKGKMKSHKCEQSFRDSQRKVYILCGKRSWNSNDHSLLYKNEGKFTKQQMGPALELKEYEPFLVLWIREYKKLSFLVSERRLARECSKYCDFSKIKTKERNKKIGN